MGRSIAYAVPLLYSLGKAKACPLTRSLGDQQKRLFRAQMRASYTLGVLCVTFSLAIVRTSAGDPQPGILGNDDRRVIEQLSAPWGAIGQINVTGYRRTSKCTGSLVATNLVITAAHCVMDPWRRKSFPLHQIHFLAGVRGSSWLGHSTAKCLHFPPKYEYVGPSRILPSLPFQDVPLRAFLRDLVLIVLKDDLNNITPLELDRAEVQSSDISDISLVHASYPADRRYVLSGHFGCHLLARDQGLWFTNCDTHAASSGGPVFIQRKEDLKLAAIMVGVAGTSSSVAVPITNWIDDGVAERYCP
jgi:protease YdgD